MAIPSFQDFMLPLLELLQDGKAHKMSEVREELAKYFDITEEEKKYYCLAEGRKFIRIVLDGLGLIYTTQV